MATLMATVGDQGQIFPVAMFFKTDAGNVLKLCFKIRFYSFQFTETVACVPDFQVKGLGNRLRNCGIIFSGFWVVAKQSDH